MLRTIYCIMNHSDKKNTKEKTIGYPQGLSCQVNSIYWFKSQSQLKISYSVTSDNQIAPFLIQWKDWFSFREIKWSHWIRCTRLTWGQKAWYKNKVVGLCVHHHPFILVLFFLDCARVLHAVIIAEFICAIAILCSEKFLWLYTISGSYCLSAKSPIKITKSRVGVVYNTYLTSEGEPLYLFACCPVQVSLL